MIKVNKVFSCLYKMLVLVLVLVLSMFFVGGSRVKAYELDYQFDKNDINISLIQTFSSVVHQGARGTNQTVYFGSKSYPNGSNTNVYGYEIAVNSQGFIIEMNTNVKMPAGGFIVSGHGTSAASMQKLELGDIVKYSEEQAKVEVYRHDVYSPLAFATFSYNNALELFENAKTNLYDFDVKATEDIIKDISSRINEMAALDTNEKLSVMDKVKLTTNKSVILDLSNEVQYRTLPFRKVESVGLWHRPTVANLTYEGTITFLDTIKEAGVNVLLVEALWNSYPIYESEIAEVQPLMKITGVDVFGPEYGNDYLLCLITEAHKRGIEVHAWSQTMRGGTSNSDSISDVPAHLKPEWIQRNYQGGITFDGPMMYLDPTNPEVVEHLKDIYTEMVTKYDWDGIELDYIRYPYSTVNDFLNGGNTSNLIDGGYTEYAMNDFLKSIGKTGSNLRELIRTNKQIRTQWSEYRTSKVTNVVLELSTMIRELNPDLDISMAVAADDRGATYYYMQDWMKWVQDGWIDTYRPMAYIGSVDQIEKYAIDYVKRANNLSQLEMGLGSAYENYPAIVNQLQMEVSIENLAIGSSIFASQQIFAKGSPSKAIQESHKAMKLHTNRYEKVSPYDHFQIILHESMDYLLDKMDRIYKPAGNFTNIDTLNNIIETVKKVEINSPSDYAAVMDALELLSGYNSMTPNKTIRARIADDINYLMNLLDLKINRELINNGYWNGKGPRPDISTKQFREFEKVDKPSDPDPIEKKGCFKFSTKAGLISVGVGLTALAGFILYRKRNV